MKRILKNKSKFKSIFLILVISLLITCGIWQEIIQKYEIQKYKSVGELYSINSHDMHLYSLGRGEDTIVFIAGSGTPCAYTDFYYLQNKLQKYARTVSFDHAGFGWSEKTDIPRKIDNLVNELHDLLETSKQTAPYILVAHSLASLEALRYAQKNPSEVKGIILLDGGSPNFYADDSEINSLLLNRTNAVLRVTGINRLIGTIGIKLPFVGENVRYSSLPDAIKKIDVAMYYNYLGNKYNLDVIRYINENAKTVIENGYLEDIPLLVLSSDSGKGWELVQQELLNWSNVSKQITFENSEHYIHWTNEKDVISEIMQFIEDY
ncbi:MAG: alpha/beta hydrolase [Lachnospiraceae bacterium]|jgi:pimeloyl-ACP methyl ester carboxylesterase|nr:alpha/beta hydrolase [Lachnospiraceae bacterium]